MYVQVHVCMRNFVKYEFCEGSSPLFNLAVKIRIVSEEKVGRHRYLSTVSFCTVAVVVRYVSRS